MRVASMRVAQGFTSYRPAVLVLGAAAFALSLAAPLCAQGGARQRVPLLVVLVDSLPVRGARAVIERRPSGPVKDFILLTPTTATARQLSAAVFTLLNIHAVAGTVPSRNAIVRVQAAEGPDAWIETEERRAEAVVRRLRRAKAQYVPGFGVVPAVRLTVPVHTVQGQPKPKL